MNSATLSAVKAMFRRAAAFFLPFMYQAKCFFISRTATASPFSVISILEVVLISVPSFFTMIPWAHAGEAAKNEQDKESARILRNVDYMSRNGSGGGYLAAFDGLLDILKRAAKNPTFYDSYSKLAAPFLAVFRS